MADTRTLLNLLRQVDDAGGKLVLVGDERQVPSVDVGGMLPRIGQLTNIYELTINHRFDDLRQRDAAEQIRQGDPATGIHQLQGLGLVHEHDRADDAWDHLVTDWLDLVEEGQVARMYADTNHLVDDLNQHARTALVAAGTIAQATVTFTDDDSGRDLDLAAGDRVRLGLNTRLPQPDGERVAVRNGMEGQIVAVHQTGVTVRLDEQHRNREGHGEIWLPAGYTAAHVAYAYAMTCDKAQATTVDHSLYAATDRACRERAYVALSRGRMSNRIYAAAASGWQDALELSRAHDPACDQLPDLPPPPSDDHAPISPDYGHDHPHPLKVTDADGVVEDVRTRLLRHHAHERRRGHDDQPRRPRRRSIAM
jgi:ATP-dependent exoDNAse (exonuclease V) alpha subunit